MLTPVIILNSSPDTCVDEPAPPEAKLTLLIDVSQSIQEHSVQKVVHIVKWMPPDPNDHSNYIEPEP